jgi:hypothetical protein
MSKEFNYDNLKKELNRIADLFTDSKLPPMVKKYYADDLQDRILRLQKHEDQLLDLSEEEKAIVPFKHINNVFRKRTIFEMIGITLSILGVVDNCIRHHRILFLSKQLHAYEKQHTI